jgi:hypothetical protein
MKKIQNQDKNNRRKTQKKKNFQIKLNKIMKISK